MKYSRARPGPMRAMTKGEITAGRIPSFTSVKPNCTDSTAIPISHAATRPAPPPNAAPWTRAMTGFGHFAIARYIPANLRASSMFSSCEYWTMRFIQFRSAPAQKDFPFPPRTMTRTSARQPSSLNASLTRGINSSLNALCVSGLSSVTRATGFWTSTFNMGLHPENAEACFFHRGIHGRGNSQSKNHSGVRRINDTIIPEPGRAVVSVPLGCVFVQCRLHEFLLLLGAHGFSLGLHLIHLHLQKDLRR